ncbi:MAG: adenylosuccinate synthetase, partial [Candidatus Obscuribacterales bacterium]|nr:adenylosuccinate synthetase [Candidatus Obscuribacterales bacterium]
SVYIDPRAIISTPFDILLNQAVEIKRGGARHGSCGLGINETVTRCLRENEFKTQVLDLYDERKFALKLEYLKEKWLNERLKELRLEADCDLISSFLAKTEKIIERYMTDARCMLEHSIVCEKAPGYARIIFEGAQGLLLDEARLDKYPHLTRSRTGLHNVIELCPQFEIEELEVTYVSRTYLTKHGAGPLPGENDWKFADRTNISNQFQGSLRFAALDFDELNYSISLDLAQARRKFTRIKAGLALSCADQLKPPELEKLPLPLHYLSEGPTRDSIQKIAKEPAEITREFCVQ